ncbi:hypothetical protein [Gracilibacillus salinarum]|uniref:Uncharacterized protein n=1 Tax=Gracilibacillus salinarum TaxID=2932255 RepID=A0ABY4GGN9_9BACI|nr:hypothetical protein [Gracilibacillus salinarum]UOQ83404.1 hypothetical protein MUN87_11580 [Gracilibacillus salinarum]
MNDSTYLQHASLVIEAITIQGGIIDRSMKIAGTNMKELPLSHLENDEQEKLKKGMEFNEVFVMPKDVFDDLVANPLLDVLDVPTNCMILLN